MVCAVRHGEFGGDEHLDGRVVRDYLEAREGLAAEASMAVLRGAVVNDHPSVQFRDFIQPRPEHDVIGRGRDATRRADWSP